MSSSPQNRQKRQRKQKSRKDQAADQLGPRGIAIGVGIVILLGVGIIFSFPIQDRPALSVFAGMIVGLAFVIIGACSGVEKEMAHVDERLHYRRPGSLFRSRIVPSAVLNLFYVLGLGLGLVRAFLHPRRSWPAIAWILSGIAIITLCIAIFNVLELK